MVGVFFTAPVPVRMYIRAMIGLADTYLSLVRTHGGIWSMPCQREVFVVLPPSKVLFWPLWHLAQDHVEGLRMIYERIT